MNHTLERRAKEVALADAGNERLRLAFGYECVLRVRHLLEEPEVEQCLRGLGAHLAGTLVVRGHRRDPACGMGRA